MNVGILGLQGAVEPHRRRLIELGADVTIVRRPEHLKNLAAIILPGGESSTMLKLLDRNELFQPLKEFVQTRPVWGLCAGSILLAKTVTHPNQDSLGVMDIRAVRNAYGRQLNSFISDLEVVSPLTFSEPIEGVFIRAPKIEVTNPEKVKTILKWENEPVMVQQGHCLAATFHPELSRQGLLHKYFLDLAQRYN